MTRTLTVKTASLAVRAADTLVIYVARGVPPAGLAGKIWTATGLDWKKTAKAARFTGKSGEDMTVISPGGASASRLLVLGGGKPGTKTGPFDWTSRGGVLAGKLMTAKTTRAAIVLDADEMTPDAVAELAAGMRLRHHRFDKYKTAKTDDRDTGAPEKMTVTLHVKAKPSCDKAIAGRNAVVEGTLLARDLVNEPANTLGPVEFAGIASGLGEHGLDVEILGDDDMEKLGMGALLSVAHGSARPARLAVMRWHGGKKKDAPIAFVGKGVCFDSGGLSIKPAASMEDMKGDMGGAAAVTGLMKTLALRKAKINAVGVIGLVENMPSGTATRPGDIVTAMSGTTIEVLNTDAEGRLVLADALWYAQDRFAPRAMINLATLTGAIVVALGDEYAGLFSNSDDLAQNLTAAGLVTGEKLWRMPLGPAYDKLIRSKFADIRNTGGSRWGGAITAAQFLLRFVNDVPWAHIDLGGPAFGGPATDINKGWASGFGVALLDRYVRDNYEG